jgi:hypothetical protein
MAAMYAQLARTIDHRLSHKLRTQAGLVNYRESARDAEHNICYLCDCVQGYHDLTDDELERYIEHVFRRQK